MHLCPQAVHNLPLCVSVCVRPRCPAPPRVAPIVHHMSLSPSRLVCPCGLPLLLRKQPIWAAGDTPHLMLVEQGLPWHPVATGLAGQAIPFVVAASHAHALPSPPFWFPVLVASLALLRPSSLPAVLALVPLGVAPAFCVCLCCSSPCLLALLPFAHPLLSHPPAPPPVRGFHICVRRSRLAGHSPVATPVAGTSRRAGHSPRPCGVLRHRIEGGGGLVC